MPMSAWGCAPVDVVHNTTRPLLQSIANREQDYVRGPRIDVTDGHVSTLLGRSLVGLPLAGQGG